MIVPVKKVKLFTLEEHKVDLLVALQKNELMMVIENKELVVNSKEQEDIIQRATSVIKRISEYQKKKDFFEYQTVEFDNFIVDDFKRNDLLESLEQDFQKYDDLKNEIVLINEEITKIQPFAKMPYIIRDLNKSLYVSFHLGYVPEKDHEALVSYFIENKIEHELFEVSKYGHPLIFVLDKDEETKYLPIIEGLKFANANLPTLDNKVARELESLNKKLQSNEQEIADLELLFANSKEIENELKILIDQNYARIARMNVPILKTEETIYVEGWVREDKIDALRLAVETVTETYDLDISEPLEDDLVPTATKNNKFVHQFETITNMYSVPNHKEVDPNPAMSIWYWIIFGIMMGDVGYGLLMVIGIGLFIKLKKPKGGMSQLMHVLYYSGYTTIAAGIVFGSVFGFDVNIIGFVGKIFGQQWNSFSVIDEPIKMLVFSIGLGVVHIVTGLVLKVILSIKQKDILTALADGFSWISILVGGSVAVIGMMLIDSKILMYLGLGFVGLGLLLILTLAGRDKKGIFGKVTSGLGGLYNSTSYLSDLLSYSRILALTLSSAVIASTMNLLASLLHGNIIGILLSVLVYLVGHIFNLAMGLLSAYVHDSRLQYIEFYNKFYEGGGIEFKPLTFENQQIKEITN
ncbi:MAG TPA: V-type ATPase 116kDa subunit family protein [Haploplasma sp.]|nr:V-type ATPase 116kDa subunit family protein [Haploplasma sp.]